MHRRKARKYERRRYERKTNCTNCAVARDALEDQIYREAYKAARDDMVKKVITAVLAVLAIIDGAVSVITLVGILQRVFYFSPKKD
jgi:hypothetical protein